MKTSSVTPPLAKVSECRKNGTDFNKFPKLSEDHEFQLEKKASSRERKINELEDSLAFQISQAQYEDEKWKLKLKQIHATDEIRLKEIATLNKMLENKDAALTTLEDELKKMESEIEGLRKSANILDLEKKRQSEKLLLLEQDKQHTEEMSKNRIGTLEKELESVNVKLNTLTFKLHMEKEISDTLRSELKTNILDLNWLKTENEIHLGTTKSQDKELLQLKDMNRELRLEIEGLKKGNAKMTKDRVMEKQLGEEKQAKMKRLEQEIENLKRLLEASEKMTNDLKSRLRTAEESVMMSSLEKEETIIALKLKQSSRELANDENTNFIVREQKKKLEQAEASNALLEAKVNGLRTQVSVLEKTKVKTLEMQKSTINNLGKMLEESQIKLKEAMASHERQETLTDKVSADFRKLDEEYNSLKALFKVQCEKLEDTAKLKETLRTKTQKLQEIGSEKTILELENSELKLKIQSLESRVTLIEEQRRQSLRIQRDTNKAFDKNIELIRDEKHHMTHERDSTESDFQRIDGSFISRTNSASDIRLAKLEKDDEKMHAQEFADLDHTDSNSNKSTDVSRYIGMLKSEKKFSLDLREKVKVLRGRNRDGAKALRKLIKNNSELERRVKSLNTLCMQMNKIQHRLVQLLDHELEYLNMKLSSNETPALSKELEPKIEKLRSGLQKEEKLLRGLYSEGKSSEYLEFGTGIGKCLKHLQSMKDSIANLFIRPVLKKAYSANDAQGLKLYEDSAPECKTTRSICCYCQTLNNVDHDQSENKNVTVTCWKCGALYLVGDKVAQPLGSIVAAPLTLFGRPDLSVKRPSVRKSLLYNSPSRSIDKGSEKSSSLSEKGKRSSFRKSDSKSSKKIDESKEMFKRVKSLQKWKQKGWG